MKTVSEKFSNQDDMFPVMVNIIFHDITIRIYFNKVHKALSFL